MATTIFNEANATYQYSGSGELLTTTSNENQITLEDFQGLTLFKTSSQDSFLPGEIIPYTITITNNSAQFLTGVRIIDNLAGGNLAYVLGSARLSTSSQTYPVSPVATNPLTFTLQQLNVGETITLTYNAQVIFNLPASVLTLTNSVQGIGYTSTGTINGFSSHSIQKKTEDNFSLTKSASLNSVYPGQTLSYFLTLRNNTGTSATLSSITDNLPANFVVTNISYRVGNGSFIELSESDYILTGTNSLTLPSQTGPTLVVPAEETLVVRIIGYFS